MNLQLQQILNYQQKILTRREQNARIFPRREVPEPYYVLVSETMLQQTQAERVVPKFLQFVGEVPDLEALAELERKDLLRLWSGLGFNSRAMRLQQTAQIVLQDHAGEIPHDREVLRRFPGIGAYSSASIPAFAYNRTEPVVDTNIRRVMIHELGIDHVLKPKQLEVIALQCVPEGRSRDRHNALMDYGALVVTAKATGIKSLGKQSKFEGSRRQVRGNVLKWLTKHGRTPLETLRLRFMHDEFESIIDEMVRQELVSREGGKVFI